LTSASPDKRTRSKWSRVLRYAALQKDDKEPLAKFIKRKGGINNARCDRADASGDLQPAGDQSPNFNDVRQGSEQRGFAG
jgi:hypothetical protein